MKMSTFAKQVIQFEILTLTKLLLKLSGVLPMFGDDFEQYKFGRWLKICLLSTPLLIVLVTDICYLFVNLLDITKSTDALYLANGYFISTGMYWFLIANRFEIRDLLNTMQQIVNERNFI